MIGIEIKFVAKNEVNIQVQKFTRNTRVQLDTGSSVIKTFAPSVGPTASQPSSDDARTHQYTLSQVEMLAQAVIDTLRL